MILLKPWVSNDLVARRWHQKLWRKFISAQCVSIIIACNVFCHFPFPDNIIPAPPPFLLLFVPQVGICECFGPPSPSSIRSPPAPGPSLSTLISIDNECTVHTVNLKTGANLAPVPHPTQPTPASLLIPLVWWDCSTFTRENILIRY